MSEKQQRLVLSIIEFLNQSIADGTVKQDDREGLEVAVQCIGEAFGVDPNDESQVGRLSIKPASLSSLFDLFMKTRERMSGSTPSTSTPSPAASSSKVDKEAAEKEKEKGNKFVSAKKYNEAIEAYGRAIALNPSNAVYYSNRAAAHSFNNDHPSAIIDAQKALEVDSKFVKAYNRLGCVFDRIQVESLSNLSWRI
ncbi:TPR-like protein [Schizopora paradoxa]|uniref:TPR-like protein n=1 Tax=Schizopora paradoxa TaxID=27342 RepID=A0A0H2S9E3_9AGAM|nr:TPR-like protein [Schizopora paradoxa]